MFVRIDTIAMLMPEKEAVRYGQEDVDDVFSTVHCSIHKVLINATENFRTRAR